MTVTQKAECCGCSACALGCPKHCIKLAEDAEGFLYPLIDNKVCVTCGKCDSVCPMQHSNVPQIPLVNVKK